MPNIKGGLRSLILALPMDVFIQVWSYLYFIRKKSVALFKLSSTFALQSKIGNVIKLKNGLNFKPLDAVSFSVGFDKSLALPT